MVVKDFKVTNKLESLYKGNFKLFKNYSYYD